MPVTGRTGLFGGPLTADIGISSAHVELATAAGMPLSGPVLKLLGPTLNNLCTAGCIDFVAVVASVSEVDGVRRALRGLVDLGELADRPVDVVGIDKRSFGSMWTLLSVALDSLSRGSLSRDSTTRDFRSLSAVAPASVALVHRVEHAYAPPELIRRVVAEARGGAPAAVPVLPCTDTVKRLDEHDVIIDTPDRTWLRVAQAPVGFNLDSLRSSSSRAPSLLASDLPAGTRTVPGHPAARAIRTSFDLAFAEGRSLDAGSAAVSSPA